METNKLIAGIVAAAIAVIMLAGVLMPALSNATTTEDTLINEGLFNAKTIDENTEATITFDHTKPTIITIDGVDFDMMSILSQSSLQQVTVLFSDDWFVRCLFNTANKAIVVYKCGTSSAQAIGGASESNGNDMTITISAGSATITYGETTLNYDVEGDGAMITPDKGDYVIKKGSQICYVKSDSVVYGVGRTDNALGSSGTAFNFIGKATIEDGMTALYYSPQYTFSSTQSMNYTTDDAHVDSYILTGFTFNLTSNGVDYPITYSQIFVPSEVTVERSVHVNDAMNTILSVIPIIIIVAVLLGVVAIFMIRRE